jgi:hypothetical protein
VAVARDDDHSGIHGCAAGRLPRGADRGLVAAELRLAWHRRRRRRGATGDGGGARPPAAGIAALSDKEGQAEAAPLQLLDVSPTQSAGALDLASSNPIAMLFCRSYALQPVLLWIIFFRSLMHLFLFAY